MTSLPLFIAIKYLRGKRKGFLSFISTVGFLGIALGVAVLIIVSSVMNGFEKELKDRVLQSIPHASIYGDVKYHQIKKIRDILSTNEKVEGSSPYIETQALIGSSQSLKGIYMFGIHAELEKNVSLVSSRLIEGNWESISNEKYGIVIGDILAFQLGLNLGDTVNILVPDTSMSIAGLLPRTKRFRVTGIFSIGAPEMDQSFAYINIKNAQKLLRIGDSVHGIRIKYKDLFEAPELVEEDIKIVNQTLKTYLYSTNCNSCI